MPTTNTLFAILAIANPDALKTAITARYPDESLEVGPGQWFVVRPSTTTTIELSAELGITDGSISGAIILSASSYYGRTRPSTWEWIAAKTGATLNVVQAG